MILRGVSHSFRSLLRKLVRIVVPIAPSAAYSGDLFQTTRIATRTAIDSRWYPLVSITCRTVFASVSGGAKRYLRASNSTMNSVPT